MGKHSKSLYPFLLVIGQHLSKVFTLYNQPVSEFHNFSIKLDSCSTDTALHHRSFLPLCVYVCVCVRVCVPLVYVYVLLLFHYVHDKQLWYMRPSVSLSTIFWSPTQLTGSKCKFFRQEWTTVLLESVEGWKRATVCAMRHGHSFAWHILSTGTNWRSRPDRLIRIYNVCRSVSFSWTN